MLTINFLGDSITEGAAADKEENTFVYLVGQMVPCVTRNYGISGTRFAKQISASEKPRYDLFFASRVDDMDNTADYVFVFGGTNDYGHGDAPFGQFGDKTVNSFYGSIDYLINKLLTYYKKEQIIFVLPLYRFNEDSPHGDGRKEIPCPPLSMYREAITQVVQSYQIRILDIKDQIGKADKNPLIADGLHPNNEGHHKIARLISDYVLQNLINN